MLIQWYPGHMTKARRMLVENLKLIDVVVEIVDARAPAATRNPDFEDLFHDKQRIIILNKSDLASPVETKRWIEFYGTNGILAAAYVATNSAKRSAALDLIQRAARERVAKQLERGIHKTVRVMVAGIPNAGKSTFINGIAGAGRAQVGDRPGVTKAKQWVKITPYLELMDTPGLLWPKLENEAQAKHLAYIGSIKDDIMDVEQLSSELLGELMQRSPDTLKARYKKLEQGMNAQDLLSGVCESRGFVLPGVRWDTERAARIVLDEFRAGKIGRITLETVENQ